MLIHAKTGAATFRQNLHEVFDAICTALDCVASMAADDGHLAGDDPKERLRKALADTSKGCKNY